MEQRGDEVHVDTDEARGGSTPHIVRYVLIISLVLAIVALTAIWVLKAGNSDQPSTIGEVSGQATPTQ
jgi:hypothetical protein